MRRIVGYTEQIYFISAAESLISDSARSPTGSITIMDTI
ncbi:hypothetical protein FBZ92_1454 [Nitrospirillum viridazoti]|uniref:Uncharacterized protein n=1 Tax=Nitrospirillum amazonense TaxID=28077 RepID=A0A560HJE8_9PROT|nr:hypothetical protein FBZ92_1454 [Nitrospirillum amazonense]